MLKTVVPLHIFVYTTVQFILLYLFIIFWKSLVLLFCKDAFNWSKVTVKTFRMFQKIFEISNFFELCSLRIHKEFLIISLSVGKHTKSPEKKMHIYICIYVCMLSGIHSHSHLPQQSPDHNHLTTDHPHLQSSISTPSKTRFPQTLIVRSAVHYSEQSPDPVTLTCATYLTDRSPTILLRFSSEVLRQFLVPRSPPILQKDNYISRLCLCIQWSFHILPIVWQPGHKQVILLSNNFSLYINKLWKF